MQWPDLEESRRNSCWWKNQERCLPARRKESKNNIGQTGNGTCVFWRCEAVCCGTGWLDFIQARKLVSSGGIRVGRLHVVTFLLLHDGLYGVCLGLAYLAKQTWNLHVEGLGLFGSLAVQCIWSLPQWLPSCSLVRSCWVPGQHARSSPNSPGLHQGGDQDWLPAAKANASGQCFPSEMFPGPSCQQERKSGNVCVCLLSVMSFINTLGSIQITLKSIGFFWVWGAGSGLFVATYCEKPKSQIQGASPLHSNTYSYYEFHSVCLCLQPW